MSFRMPDIRLLILSTVVGAIFIFHGESGLSKGDQKKTDRKPIRKEVEYMSSKPLFELLVRSKGERYVKYRQQWWDDENTYDAGLGIEDSPDREWLSCIQEQILLGWKQNRKFYLEMLEQIDEIDVTLERR